MPRPPMLRVPTALTSSSLPALMCGSRDSPGDGRESFFLLTESRAAFISSSVGGVGGVAVGALCPGGGVVDGVLDGAGVADGVCAAGAWSDGVWVGVVEAGVVC